MSLPSRQELENLKANALHDEAVAIAAGLEMLGERRSLPYWQLLEKWDAELKAMGQ